MRIHERACGSLVWALSSFVLLVGIVSMHGLTSHDVGMPGMGSPSVGHGEGPQPLSSQVLMMAVPVTSVPNAVKHPGAESSERGVASVPVSMIWSGAPTAVDHAAMELCVAVLSLLLLLIFLVRACGDPRGWVSHALLRSLRRMAGRAPPDHLCPSLTGLCVARV